MAALIWDLLAAALLPFALVGGFLAIYEPIAYICRKGARR